MWFAKTIDGFRGWFRVQGPSGTPRVGIIPGDFTVTVVDPTNTTTAFPTVTESIKGGLYFFDIASAFLIGGGIGEYGVLVEVATTTGSPKVKATFSAALKVNTKGFEDIGTGLTAADIADAVWDELIAGHLGAGSTGAFLSRILQLAQPDVDIDPVLKTVTVKDKDTGAPLLVYSLTGEVDTRVTKMDA